MSDILSRLEQPRKRNEDGQICHLHMHVLLPSIPQSLALSLPVSLPLFLSLACITADALVIREKVGISFARLIPEVNVQRNNRESGREPGKRKKGGKVRWEGWPIAIASVRLSVRPFIGRAAVCPS